MNISGKFDLLPSVWQGHDSSTLRTVYERAFSEAEELFIVSAFLTEWQSSLKLNPRCSAFLLIVGADFGTTRKAALEAALKWLPKRFPQGVLAFNQSGTAFHPKAMLWRERDGSCFMLIGSSNLTKAAFDNNVEANVTLRLDEEDYLHAMQWLSDIENRSVEVNKSWLSTYVEAPVRGGKGRKRSKSDDDGAEPDQAPVFDLSLEVQGTADRKVFDQYLQIRRDQKAAFTARAKEPLISLVQSSATKATWGKRDDQHFYRELVRLWSATNEIRMGGDQWQMTGKHANQRELAKSLKAVIDARDVERDAVVVRERDRLHGLRVPTRAAVFTELLCHLFPKRYPILDAPVRAWRQHVGFDARVGGTEGERYLRLARAMRAALRQEGPQNLGIKDLAELDVLIWLNFRRDSAAVPA